MVHLNTQHVELLLAKRNREKKWLAEQVKVSPVYLSLIMTHRRTVSPEMRTRVQAVFRSERWDNLFRLVEVKE